MRVNVVEHGGWRDASRNTFRKAASCFAIALALAFALAPTGSARASTSHRRAAHAARLKPQIAMYRAALLEDADTGKVLFDTNAAMVWPPASMAKMMLLLVASEQIKAGRFTADDPVRISERSAHTGGSRVGFEEGQVYPLGELMKAALVKSANDAAVAVAEKIGGSVEAAVRMMNLRAQELSMTETEYHTVDGLPPRPTHDADRTCAHDLAIVARALIHETDLLKWSSQEECPFDGGVCMLRNTNHLVGQYEGLDGLKTGYTFEAGFNLTATARRGNLRLISVILGAPSNQQRFAQTAHLLDWGFDHYTSIHFLHEGEPLPVRVQVESGPVIQPIAAQDLNLVLPRTEVSGIHVEYKVPPTISGPLTSGERVGEVVVEDRGETMAQVNALCPVAVGATTEQVRAVDGWDSPASAADHQVNQ